MGEQIAYFFAFVVVFVIGAAGGYQIGWIVGAKWSHDRWASEITKKAKERP